MRLEGEDDLRTREGE